MTTIESLATGNTCCREITPEEVEHYHEFGWVMLRQFISPEMIGRMLAKAKGLMGEDGDSNPPYGIDQPYFNAQAAGGFADPAIRPSFYGFGKAAKALMARQDGTGVRLFNDNFVPKLPAARKTRNQGNGPTSFHQDFISFGVDRSGGMTFWVALEAYGPESGTMQFVGGSHRLGVLGGFMTGKGDLLEDLPELRDLPVSEPMRYAVGDVTVHSHLTVHGAGRNLTEKPRWAYLITVNPADAVWTGAQLEAFDPAGMTPYEPFDDDRFPILA